MGEATWPAYPDTDVSLAAVLAEVRFLSPCCKVTDERATLEFELLRRLHPAERGELAGRGGTYVELAAEWLREARGWGPVPGSGEWVTLGGSARVTAWPTDP